MNEYGRPAHNMVLKPTHLVVTPSAKAEAAPPAASVLRQCYASQQDQLNGKENEQHASD